MADDEVLVWMDDLEPEICWRLLARRSTGRLGFVAQGEPVVLPVNHAVDGHSIVIRTGETGMLEALGAGATAAFEVDEMDALPETGWSVLVKGFASRSPMTSSAPTWSACPFIRGRRDVETDGYASCRPR